MRKRNELRKKEKETVTQMLDDDKGGSSVLKGGVEVEG